jgi:protein gp37
MNAIDYSEYTVNISADPCYYGDACTTKEAARIMKRLTAMIADKFPWVRILGSADIGGARVTGPDESMCEEIRAWVQDNWTAAL